MLEQRRGRRSCTVVATARAEHGAQQVGCRTDCSASATVRVEVPQRRALPQAQAGREPGGRPRAVIRAVAAARASAIFLEPAPDGCRLVGKARQQRVAIGGFGLGMPVEAGQPHAIVGILAGSELDAALAECVEQPLEVSAGGRRPAAASPDRLALLR